MAGIGKIDAASTRPPASTGPAPQQFRHVTVPGLQAGDRGLRHRDHHQRSGQLRRRLPGDPGRPWRPDHGPRRARSTPSRSTRAASAMPPPSPSSWPCSSSAIIVPLQRFFREDVTDGHPPMSPAATRRLPGAALITAAGALLDRPAAQHALRCAGPAGNDPRRPVLARRPAVAQLRRRLERREHDHAAQVEHPHRARRGALRRCSSRPWRPTPSRCWRSRWARSSTSSCC